MLYSGQCMAGGDGLAYVHSANATRDFCPPDSVKIGLSARLPVRPILPRCALVCTEALYGEESPAAIQSKGTTKCIRTAVRENRIESHWQTS